MEDLYLHTPGSLATWSRAPNGDETITPFYDCAHSFTRRVQTSYTGPRIPDVMHPYTLNVQDMELSLTYYYKNADNSSAGGSGDVLHQSSNNGVIFHPTFDDVDAALTSEALEKLSTKVRGNLDISVDLAQSRQTIKMLNAVDQAEGYIRDFRDRFPVFRLASKAWLTWQYGLKPTLGTIFGAADENIRFILNQISRHTARASGVYSPDSVGITTRFGGLTFPLQGATLKRSITFGVDLRSSRFDLDRWTSLNPASLAWETLPLSFVADWFLDVGSYLRNLETWLLYEHNFRSGYRTVLTAGEVRVDTHESNPVFPMIEHESSFTGFVKVLFIERSLLNGYPAPRFPSFNAQLGSHRLLSAAALMAQLLKR